MKATVTLDFDPQPMIGALEELSELLPQLAERFPEIRSRLVSLIETVPEALVIESDGGSAPGANHLVVVAKPSDRLIGLMTALWARDADLRFIEDTLSHFCSPKERP